MFRPEMATAMAAFFLMRTEDCTLNDLRLMKLMVISERRYMEATTALITGSRFASMQNGPVLSDVLNLMKGKVSFPFWNEHIEFVPFSSGDGESNRCVLKQAVQVEEYLSGFAIQTLESVWQEFKDKSKWGIVDITHEFPEWDSECARTKSSSPISFKSIFENGLHLSSQEARERAREIEYFEAVSA